MPPKELLSEIRKRKNKVFLVSAHIHLEGDALGSELAIASLLRKLGKKVVILNDDIPPLEYDFMPGIKLISQERKDLSYDAAILVDCSDISRIGKISRVIKKDRLLINIDHHISNTKFGDINWVKPQASCACELVYELFKALKIKINKDEALLLYTGILVDTGSFKYSTTSSWTHVIASDLIKQGLDVYGVYRRLHESMSFHTIKSLAAILATLQTDKTGKVSWLVIKNSLLINDPVLAEATDNVISFARSIKGVEVALLFKEIRKLREVRVNLRSTGKVDVNKIAQVFGGGGHKMASGCTLKGSLKDAVKQVTWQAQKRVSK